MTPVVSRRAFLGTAGAMPIVFGLRAGQPAMADETPFGRPDVIAAAAALASAPYAPPEPRVPEALQDLTYQAYQSLRARPETWLFAGSDSGFAVEPLHTGFIYRDPVQIFHIENGQAVKLGYDRDAFEFPAVEGLEIGTDLEFAGFRARTTLNDPALLDPFVVFAGASYFQAVARGQEFGISARGLAIRTGEPGGEEFPIFRTFWIEPPADGRMVVHALLDSPSVTGAYRFTIRPGDETLIDIEATLFARAEIDRIGLAPLTSMFLHDVLGRRDLDDARLSVHDSDGLAIWNGKDERIWRPLSNPRLLQISAFKDIGPRGFGLIQREKRFSVFEDLEARYERRPSYWIEPIGDWGPGSVVLVEIPSSQDIHDNIVAFWRPEAPLAEGSQTTFTYRLTAGWDAPNPAGLLRVTRTLTGASPREGWRRFTIDYSEPGGGPSRSVVGLEAKVQTSDGIIDGVVLRDNPLVGGVRVAFDMNPDGLDSADIRVDLLGADGPAAEVWVYRWSS